MQRKMTRLTPIICLIMLFSTLQGCSKLPKLKLPSLPNVYTIDIQQGNVVTQDMVNKLKPGMTPSQVKFVMGSPLIVDTFNQNRWDYFYSIESGVTRERRQERVSLFFENGQLVSIEGDFQPQIVSEDEANS